MARYLIVCTMLFATLRGSTQNLVPNPSFEDTVQCPFFVSQITFTTGWYSVFNTPDYYNACNNTGPINPGMVGVPNNARGYQPARTGQAYAGVVSYWSSSPNYREHFETQLIAPLTAGITYDVGMWVVLQEDLTMWAIDGMGILLSNTGMTGSPFTYTPQIINPVGNVLNDTLNWVLVSGQYTAVGGEQYITIGNFRTDAMLTVQNFGGGIDFNSYAIEDVYVQPATNCPNPVNILSTGVTDLLCFSDTSGQVDVSANGGVGPQLYYQWSNGQTDSSATALGAGAYTLTITDSTGCDTILNFSVSSPSQLAGVITDTTMVTCGGGSDGVVIVTPTGGTSPYTYNWSGGAGTDSTATGLSAGIYSVTVTDTNNCDTVVSITITEPPPVVGTVSGDTSICLGDSALLVATGGPGYSWSTGAISDSIWVTPSITSTYNVTVTIGACTDIASITVTVNTAPIATILGDTTFCETDSITLTASGGTGYLWSNGATTSGITVSPSTSTIYIVTVSNGACSDAASHMVTPDTMPILSILGNDSICTGGNTTLTTVGGPPYSWNTGGTTDTITVNPAVNTQYSVTVTNGSCMVEETLLVFVLSAPAVNISGGTNVCNGNPTALIATGGGSYLWNTGETTSTINFFPSNSGYHSVTVTNVCGTVVDSVMVTVNSFPSVNAGEDTTILQGGIVQLNGTGSDTNMYWTPTAGLSCNTCNDPLASPDSTTSYILFLTDANGCTATDTITITVNQSNVVFVPNIFSPNGDGNNDVFYFRGNLMNMNGRVFNRWGEMVFETTNPNSGWDGSHRGQPLNSGVYVYFLSGTANGEDVIEKGNLTLIR